MTRMWRKEWPPGSGEWGDYTESEYRIVVALFRQQEAGEITADELRSQVDMVHALVQLGGRLVPEPHERPVAGRGRYRPDASPAAQERLPDPASRRVGPYVAGSATSEAAAVAAFPQSGTQRFAVLRVIGESGDRGATDWEIEVALSGKHQGVSARRNELARDGWIVDSGRTRPTDSGRDATVWVLSPGAREPFRLTHPT